MLPCPLIACVAVPSGSCYDRALRQLVRPGALAVSMAKPREQLRDKDVSNILILLGSKRYSSLHQILGTKMLLLPSARAKLVVVRAEKGRVREMAAESSQGCKYGRRRRGAGGGQSRAGRRFVNTPAAPAGAHLTRHIATCYTPTVCTPATVLVTWVCLISCPCESLLCRTV